MISNLHRRLHYQQVPILPICLMIGMIWFCTFMIFRQAPEWDNMEELVWANSFEMGYQKHPPLPSWVLYPLTMIFGKVVWLPYALGLICVASAQWISYLLYVRVAIQAKVKSPEDLGVLAVLATSPLIYYTIRGGDYNHNAMQLWSIAAMYYFYYRAWEQERNNRFQKTYYVWWALFGMMMGLALISKYSVVIQIAVLGGHFLTASRWRWQKAWIGVLIAFGVFVFVAAPHLHWLYQQSLLGQGPIYYASQLMSVPTSFGDRVIDLFVDFLLTQVYRLLPCFIVVGYIYYLCKQSKLQPNTSALNPSWWSKVSSEDRLFLIFLGLGPCLTAVGIGMLFNQNIEAKWAVTFFIIVGFISWVYANDTLDMRRVTRVVIAGHIIFALGFGILTGPGASYIGKQGRASFPSQEMAKVIQQRWLEHPELTDGKPIGLVVGDTWIIGHMVVHDPVHQGKDIKPWINANDLMSPWMTEKDKQQVALILIDQGPKSNDKKRHLGHPPSKEVQHMFDLAPVKGIESIPWTIKEGAPPLQIQWAILPYKPS
ncbi:MULTISPECIES: glycosyltransferase family 39 protein [unclassified Polynucleobacter]|uniref:glycosyltransferase family 39 protein n=1 Tax=unclassified Polynucleobacter TaxID=2640945 RepID=UPI0024926A1C|nr:MULTISPECIES: glycosyltransferase family 39 protein [unclassified Polynucleobacter]